MKVTYKGHDPDLGRKFAQESNGSVIGLGNSRRGKSVTQENPGQRPPQEAQDEVIAALVRRLELE